MSFRIPVANSTIPEISSSTDVLERELYHNTSESVAKLFALGFTVEDIAERTGLTNQQVMNRLKPIRKKWEEEASQALGIQVGREVEASNYLIQMGVRGYLTTANPAYLLVAQRAAKMRADVLALSKRMGDRKSGGSSIQDLLTSIQDSPLNEVSSAWKEDDDS